MGDTRHFWFWCANCPTRITIDTETPYAGVEGEPQYCGDGVGAVSARVPTAEDSGLEPAYLCPACGEQLDSLDDLLARGLVPYAADGSVPQGEKAVDAHEEWLRKARIKS